ncbi:MAG: hypothetical protein D6761_08150 [Candidatus Dadabacteria bacterium]|nr:MAG: hypothetical protein D6761_08150 [Candidatus Dadabacteria bacterium]
MGYAGEDKQAERAAAALLHNRRTPRQLELLYRLPDREPQPGTRTIRFTLPRSSPFQHGTAALELVERIPEPPPWQLAIVALLFASSMGVLAITRTRSPAARR